MKIMSFAWTTPALVAGAKTVTRRDWTAEYAARFRSGDFIEAWDKQPRFRGARPVAIVQLTADPTLQPTTDAPDSDWHAEGFEYMWRSGARVDGMTPRELWRAWHGELAGAALPDERPRRMWVVRFRLVGLVDDELAAAWRELSQQARRDRAAMVLDKSPDISLTVKRAAVEVMAESTEVGA